MLNESALKSSAIKVHARPWTVVIGDGLLSELITSFFTWDYSGVIDRGSFMQDMAAGDVGKARWCSPLLVNAICALRCQFLEGARLFTITTRQNLWNRFLEETKRLLDRENNRASIPTVQALIFMYLARALVGNDRIARVYRFTAFVMLRRLRLEQRFHNLKASEPSHIPKKGGRVAFYYAEPSSLPAPNVPKLFHGHEIAGVDGISNIDVLGEGPEALTAWYHYFWE
ncbi:hypothetical protein AK830_g3527 [Neonectria ditissima]|uniref:Xylanolytic transcriptional activator regulatory domain-containing protein n=1 Tax=Neonectria ditissima TaxID=78410 RepID=A0A0P7BHW0_9HYPO|nr:hypothetical protein AK830_g3527 [Neonectria ditissima]